MAETVPGGFYIGVDGKAHDAWGKPIALPDVVIRIAEPEEAAPQEEAPAAVEAEEPEKPEPKRKAKR